MRRIDWIQIDPKNENVESDAASWYNRFDVVCILLLIFATDDGALSKKFSTHSQLLHSFQVSIVKSVKRRSVVED